MTTTHANVSLIPGRFSRVFEYPTKDGQKLLRYINFYFLGGRFRVFAPTFEILPDTDYLVTFCVTASILKDHKGFDKTVLIPATVLSVKPL